MASKYISRTMEEVYDLFHNNFGGDVEEIIWYLEELISKLQDELDYYQTFNGEENE